MLKRILFVVVACVLLFGLVIGVEVWLVLRAEFLPTEPALELGGVFGRRGDPPLKFVVLGDSTAAGLGADSPDDAYATVVARRLAAGGRRVELVALGVSGARVKDVLEEQVPLAEKEAPDLIFVGIGANDATHLTSLSDVESDMRALLERLQETGAHVVVAGAPDMRAKAFLEPLRSIVGWRGRQATRVIHEVAAELGVPVVPLAEKTAPFFAEDPERAYASDDFHPSSAGYAAWADAIHPVLESVLAEGS